MSKARLMPGFVLGGPSGVRPQRTVVLDVDSVRNVTVTCRTLGNFAERRLSDFRYFGIRPSADGEENSKLSFTASAGILNADVGYPFI